MGAHLKHASRLLQKMPLELTAEDKVHLSDEERGQYDVLMHERKQIHGKLRRIQMQAIFRRFLTPEQQERFAALELEEAEIKAKFALSDDRRGEPSEADLMRLRKIGHEFNDLVAAAYLQAVVHGRSLSAPDADQEQRLSA